MSISIQHPEGSVNSVSKYRDSTENLKLQISASAIGKIIDHDQCPRYSRLRVDRLMEDEILDGIDTRGNKNRGWNDYSPLNSILANEGQRFENSVYDTIEKNSKRTIRNYRAEEDDEDELRITKPKLKTIRNRILSGVNTALNSDPGNDPVVMLQTPLTGIIGEFSVVGYSDLIIVWPEEGNNITIRVIDIKASWSEKTSHQLQTATYTTLLRDVLEEYEDQYGHSFEYTMEGGILNRESDFAYPDKHKLPKFELDNRETDIKRMLSKNGEIHRSLVGEDSDNFEDIEYQLDKVCQSCEYREVCYADSYDRADIALLGISRGEQKALREQGIETVHQVADLAQESNKSPVKFEKANIKSVHRDTVTNLPKELQLKIPELSQLAKEMLPNIDPSDPNAGSTWLNTKAGVGSANLPDDDPNHANARDKLNHPPGKLVKVFVNVQEDYVTDRTVLLSASVDAGEFSSDPLQVSESIENIPVNNEYEFKFDELDMNEKQLLENFTEKLYTAINTVGRAIGQYPDASVHFYFYTENEYTRLIDSLKRYENSNDATDSLRDLLSLRKGPEQQMYSVLQTEIQKLYHIDQLPESLITLSDRFYPNEEEYQVSYEDTVIEDSNGNEIPLKSKFQNKLFDYTKRYEQRELQDDPSKDTAYIKFRESEIKDDDEYIPFSADHQGSDIPLEYIWGCKEIDILSPEWIKYIKEKQSKLLSEDEQIEEEFQKNIDQLQGVSDIFRWIDKGNERLRTEHVEEMSKLLTLYMREIEADIFYKDSYIEKPQLDISNLPNFKLNKTFEETIEDYIDMEFDSDKSEKMAHYQLSIEERIQTGKSIPVQVTDVIDQGGTLLFRGNLAYEDLGFDNPELMAASCRKTGSEGGDSSSWMVASLLEQNGDTFIEQNGGSPTKLQHSPSTTVERFNTNDMTIEFTHTQFGASDPKYNTWRKSFITPEDEKENNFQIEVQNGVYMILDPQINSYFANIKTQAIRNAQNNATNQLLKDLQTESATLTTTQYKNPTDIRKFLRWMRKTDDSITFRPNRKQKQFIKDLESKVSLLQGPPGTGKTSGAIASALAGRIYTASKSDSSVRAIVTGASNKSIDEVTNELSELIEGYNDDTDTDELQDVDIIRLSPYIQEDERKDNVKYLDYNNEEHQAEILRILEQLDNTGLNTDGTVQSTLAGTTNHTVILATPSRIHGLMKNYAEEADIEEVYEAAPNLFDIMCVDEASMMTLDKFILSGAFMSPDGQWLIAGDHRQMPPVQKFEWTEENRRNIEQYLPYLSTLNYFRYLRGDDLTDFIDEDLVEDQPENRGIKQTGLEVTYRCHEEVADFLQEWIYDKDNINYRSKETTTIPDVDAKTEGIQAALDPESPITLIIHDDTKSKQFNPVEAQIASVLDRDIPDTETTGIVTPHNSQKGYLKAVNKDCTVDTVERFQGGQKDAMMISATVSDPNYLSSESEFIFDPRRLNVAISRMKKKLIVIAPRSLFDFIPDDVELYEKSVIWAGLYDEVNGDDESAWSGTLSEFTGKELQLDATVSVYHGRT